MATITMDTSEYEALQKNITLLEEFKQNEKVLNLEIARLKDEKIQVLEDASNSVLITKKTRSEEFVRLKRPIHEVKQFLATIIRNGYVNNNFDEDFTIDMFFEKTKYIDHPVEVHTQVRGFDEFKAELKSEYLSELSQETLDQLDKLKDYEQSNRELKTEVLDTMDENKILEDKNIDLETNYRILNNSYNNLLNKIYHVLDQSWNIFNLKTKRIKILNILNYEHDKNTYSTTRER